MMMNSNKEKDLRVMIQDILSPEKHISGVVSSTYRMLSNFRVAFNYMDMDMMTTTTHPKSIQCSGMVST